MSQKTTSSSTHGSPPASSPAKTRSEKVLLHPKTIQNSASKNQIKASTPAAASQAPPETTTTVAVTVVAAAAAPRLAKKRSAWSEAPMATATSASDDNKSSFPQGGSKSKVSSTPSGVPIPELGDRAKDKDKTTSNTKGNAKKIVASHMSKYGIFLQNQDAIALCSRLGLELSHMARLQRIFESYDIYHTGEITRDEFLMSINEEKRELTNGIFSFSTMQPDQKYMNFDDFILCVATFASMTKPELYQYVFQLYDVDKSGSLDQDEFRRLSMELQSKNFSFPKNVQTAVTLLTSNGHHVASDGLIDYNDFVDIATIFPLAFFPIFNMQYNVRKTTLGLKFWSATVARKLKLEQLVRHMRKNFGNLPSMTWTERLWSLFDKDIDEVRKMAVTMYTAETSAKHLAKQHANKHLQLEPSNASKRKSTTTEAVKQQKQNSSISKTKNKSSNPPVSPVTTTPTTTPKSTNGSTRLVESKQTTTSPAKPKSVLTPKSSSTSTTKSLPASTAQPKPKPKS